MPTNNRPRKKYRQKPVARPLSVSQRVDLENAARVHLHGVYTGSMTESGWHTLTQYFNVASEASKGRHEHVIAGHALDAMLAIHERYQRTGKHGVSGDERGVIMESFNELAPFIATRTDLQLRNALASIYRAIEKMEIAA